MAQNRREGHLPGLHSPAVGKAGKEGEEEMSETTDEEKAMMSGMMNWHPINTSALTICVGRGYHMPHAHIWEMVSAPFIKLRCCEDCGTAYFENTYKPEGEPPR